MRSVRPDPVEMGIVDPEMVTETRREEAINNLIKGIKCIGFGFRRFTQYRIRSCRTPGNRRVAHYRIRVLLC